MHPFPICKDLAYWTLIYVMEYLILYTFYMQAILWKIVFLELRFFFTNQKFLLQNIFPYFETNQLIKLHALGQALGHRKDNICNNINDAMLLYHIYLSA